MEPFAVRVTVGTKVQTKDFMNRSDFDAFIQKAEELKAKAPSLKIEILKQVTHSPKEDSLAFEIIKDENNYPMFDPWGRYLFRAVRVPNKPGVLYCTNCHTYQKFENVDWASDKACKCGMTTRDFDMKIANGVK
jgi:hypothetical protein